MWGKAARIAGIVALASLFISFGTAQEESPPAHELASANISLSGSPTTQVEGVYRFRPVDGDQSLEAVSGTIWTGPGYEVTGIEASVDGADVTPTVEEQSRHLSVTVPLPGEMARPQVAVRYQVEHSADRFRTPIWVPEQAPSGEAPVITTRLAVEEGRYIGGTVFPRPEQVDGNRAVFKTLHVPGYVVADIGSGEAGALSGMNTVSAAGVLLLLVFLVGGIMIERREHGGGVV